MRMDKYGCFMQIYVYYYWNHSQQHEDLICYKGNICFSKNLFMSIWHMKKEMQGSHYFSFFALSNLLTQTCLHFCMTGQLFFSTCKMYIAFIVYYWICVPLCAQILHFDAAKLSIKRFSFIYFTVSVVRQWNEYEKVIETRPIKTT